MAWSEEFGQLVSVPEIAEWCDRTQHQVREDIRSRQLPAMILGRREYRVFLLWRADTSPRKMARSVSETIGELAMRS